MAKKIELKLVSHTEKIKGNKTITVAKIKAANFDDALGYFKGRFGTRNAVLKSSKSNVFTVEGLT